MRRRWAGHLARMGERRGLYKILVWNRERKRPLGRPRRKCKNIKMNLQELGCGGMDWIDLAKDRRQMAGFCKCGKEFSGSIKCGEFLD